MITNIRLFHAKKMHSSSGVPAPMTWLIFTLLFLSVAAAAEETTTVKVTTTPVFAQIPRLQSSKDFQVLVRVEAPPPAAQQQRRVPVDLAVVVDVGGGGATGTSTARLDAVKKAVKFIIRQILHDDDRLAIVGPSSISQLLGGEASGLLNTSDARRNAEKSVDKLEPRGDRAEFTSGAGLEEAIKILGELPATATRSRRARFIILVTDAATSGDSSRFSELLRRQDDLPPVHTLGLGAAYEPRALLDIARASQGTYSFVDDDEDTVAITGAIAVCLSGLKDVVAVGTRVRVEAPVGSGVTIERIQSGGYRTNSGIGTGDEKTSGEVAVGVLYAGEVKSFLIHLSVPALPPATATTSIDNGGCDKQQLLTATFVSAGDEEDAAAPSAQAILYVQRPAPEAIDVVAGGGVHRVPVPVVMNHIAWFAALEMVTAFVDNHIWQRTTVTADVAARLRVQWEQFVQARQFWSGLDLGALDVEVTTMVTILEAAGTGTRGGSSSSATAYMLSWLSSYQMQRPTAMGAPGSVAAAFVTVNMQLTLQQVRMVVTNVCPPCDGECEDRCVKATPPTVLVPSGRDDGTYSVNVEYLPVVRPGVLVDAINEAMKQMYLALIQANKLRTCDADNAAGVGVL